MNITLTPGQVVYGPITLTGYSLTKRQSTVAAKIYEVVRQDYGSALLKDQRGKYRCVLNDHIFLSEEGAIIAGEHS